jgi:hypothetical protein
MTPRLIAGATFAALLLGSTVQAVAPLKSGPPVGASNDRSGFKPLLVAGPATGKNLCPV